MPVTVGPDLIFCCFYLKFLLTWSPKIEGSSFLYTFKFQLWAQPLAWIQTKKSKYRLNQCFSSCNLPPDHLGIHGSADPTFCISDKLPAGVHVAGSWTTLFLFMFGSSEEISLLKTVFAISLLQFLSLENHVSLEGFCASSICLLKPFPGGLIFDAPSQLTVSGIRFQLVEIQTRME